MAIRWENLGKSTLSGGWKILNPQWASRNTIERNRSFSNHGADYSTGVEKQELFGNCGRSDIFADRSSKVKSLQCCTLCHFQLMGIVRMFSLNSSIPIGPCCRRFCAWKETIEMPPAIGHQMSGWSFNPSADLFSKPQCQKGPTVVRPSQTSTTPARLWVFAANEASGPIKMLRP
jgi:hypothetical protein